MFLYLYMNGYVDPNVYVSEVPTYLFDISNTESK